MPNRLWERVKLSPKLDVALAELAENLLYWPSYFQRKWARVRLVKLYQMINRIRRIRSDPDRIKYFAINRHRDKVESRREEKALRASQLNEAIRTELLNRLQAKTYGSLYDAIVANRQKRSLSLRDNDDLREADLEESDFENFVEAYDEDEELEEQEMEDMGEYEYEYEYENEGPARQRLREREQNQFVEAYGDDEDEYYDGDDDDEVANEYAGLDDDEAFGKLLSNASGSISSKKAAAASSSSKMSAKRHAKYDDEEEEEYEQEGDDEEEEEEEKSTMQTNIVAPTKSSVKAALEKLATAPVKPVVMAPPKAPTSISSASSSRTSALATKSSQKAPGPKVQAYKDEEEEEEEEAPKVVKSASSSSKRSSKKTTVGKSKK